MTQNTMQVPGPNAQGPQKDKSKLKFGLVNAAFVTAVAGALVFAGLSRSCKPGPEKIIKVKEKCTVSAPVEVPPKKGDGKCEAEKGENNPYSDKYDSACGYCGDGEQQEWETKENCPVDFTCEKGNERYYRTTFAAFKPMEGGKLELTTVSVTKTCKAGDKVAARRVMRPTMQPEMRPVMEPVMAVTQSGGACQEQPSGQLTGIKRTIRRNLTLKTDALWNSGQVSSDKSVTVYTRINVSATGHVSGVSISAGGRSISPGFVGLGGLNGQYIGYPTGASCYINVSKTIPRKDR